MDVVRRQFNFGEKGVLIRADLHPIPLQNFSKIILFFCLLRGPECGYDGPFYFRVFGFDP